MNAPKDVRAMTAQSVGKDLLQALVQEIRLLPDVWEKLSQSRQDDIIDRLRNRIETNVGMAVHLIASEGRAVVVGTLDQVVIKDGIKANFVIQKSAESRVDLFDAQGKECLIVVAGSGGEFLGGMDEVQGEPEQRSMNLGEEYQKNDGGGMDDDVVDAEFVGLPAPEDCEPSQDEIDAQYEAGQLAASEGLPEGDCPVMKGALCIAWVKGWKSWHEEQDSTDLE